MQSAFIKYMRAHGNTPGPTECPATAGAASGALAALPAAALLWLAGSLASLGQSVSLRLPVTLALQMVTFALLGMLYGRIFGRAANDRRGGWLFGISSGFLIWMLGPAMLLQWIIGRPVATGVAAMGLMGAHLIYGVALGLIFPYVHRRLRNRSGDEAGRKAVAGSTDARAERHKEWQTTTVARP
ncbi:MAG TPA: hypothetical protein VFD58_28070 [Blastocatellia bacterium]|nr:hypothetical protein [Blastocatellia bacterium]